MKFFARKSTPPPRSTLISNLCKLVQKPFDIYSDNKYFYIAIFLNTRFVKITEVYHSLIPAEVYYIYKITYDPVLFKVNHIYYAWLQFF